MKANEKQPFFVIISQTHEFRGRYRDRAENKTKLKTLFWTNGVRYRNRRTCKWNKTQSISFN